MPKRKAVHNSNNHSTNNNDHSSMWSSSRSSKKAQKSTSSGSGGYSSSSAAAAASEARIEHLWSMMNNGSNNEDDDEGEEGHHDPNISTMEGFSVFCEALDLDPLEDVRVLVLLWKLKAVSKPACITKTEWVTACHALQCDSLDKFRNLIPSLETGFLDEDEFKDFYKFCFQFNREGTHKTLDRDLVVQLLPLVLSDTNRVSTERLISFCEFLSLDSQPSKNQYPRITLDQWTSFWDFSQEVPDDLSGYDESTSAWPVLIDEYVEYMMTKK